MLLLCPVPVIKEKFFLLFPLFAPIEPLSGTLAHLKKCPCPTPNLMIVIVILFVVGNNIVNVHRLNSSIHGTRSIHHCFLSFGTLNRETKENVGRLLESMGRPLEPYVRVLLT